MSKPIDGFPTRAEQDQAEAFELYRIAAEQGVAGAQCRLGVMYAEGQGVAQDDKESVRWFQLAAEQGMGRRKAASGWHIRRWARCATGLRGLAYVDDPRGRTTHGCDAARSAKIP